MLNEVKTRADYEPKNGAIAQHKSVVIHCARIKLFCQRVFPGLFWYAACLMRAKDKDYGLKYGSNDGLKTCGCVCVTLGSIFMEH